MADLVRFRRPEEGWPGEAVPQNTAPVTVQRPAGGWSGETMPAHALGSPVPQNTAPVTVQRPAGGWRGEAMPQTVPANPGEVRPMAVDYGRGITELVGTPGQQGRSFTNLIPAGAPSTGITEMVNGFRTAPQGVQGAAAPATGVTSPDAPVTATPAAAQPTGFRPALAGQTVFAPAYNAVYGSVAEQRKAFEAAQPKPLDAKEQVDLEKSMIELENLKKKPAAETKLNTFGLKQKTDAMQGLIEGKYSIDFGEFGAYDISEADASRLHGYQQQLFQDFLTKGKNTRDAYNEAVSETYKIFSTPRTK